MLSKHSRVSPLFQLNDHIDAKPLSCPCPCRLCFRWIGGGGYSTMNWDSSTFAIPRHLPSRETRPVSSTDETQLIRSVSVSPLIKFLSPCPDCRLCLASSGTPSRGNGTLIILFIPMQILITMAVTQQQENICKTTIRGVTPLLVVVVRKDTLAVTLFAKNFPTSN